MLRTTGCQKMSYRNGSEALFNCCSLMTTYQEESMPDRVCAIEVGIPNGRVSLLFIFRDRQIAAITTKITTEGDGIGALNDEAIKAIRRAICARMISYWRNSYVRQQIHDYLPRLPQLYGKCRGLPADATQRVIEI